MRLAFVAQVVGALAVAAMAACSDGTTPSNCAVLCGVDQSCPSGQACLEDGYCHSPGTPLCPVCPACNAPPEPICLDTCRVERYAAAGECVDGECAYPAEPVDCQFGCGFGACLSQAAAIPGCFAALCGSDCDQTHAEPGIVTLTLPAPCIRIEVLIWGAGGGHGRRNTNGGAGGFAGGTLEITSGESFIAVVGGPGGTATGTAGGPAGTPGGGAVGGDCNDDGGGGSGGFSGLFTGEVSQAMAVAIAGGGGGAGGGTVSQAGAGGGLTGGTPASGTAVGGNQTAGFMPLMGGPGANEGNGDGGGAGGGGYFGGTGGSGADTDAQSGGGGSGFLSARAAGWQLEGGAGALPGNASHADRDNAGDPTRPGRVVVRCVLLSE